ncbi:Sulfate adenylyltransferase subunit 1 [compost metagenome]
MDKKEGSSSLNLNSIALVNVELTEECAFDSYNQLPRTGAFAIIDRLSNVTVGAGMVFKAREATDTEEIRRAYHQAEIELNSFIRKNYPEWQCIEINSAAQHICSKK